MEILVFLCVISHLNLVLTDDNVAIDSTVTQRSTYKVHPDPEDAGPLTDQVADSSRPISQTYSRVVLSNDEKEIPDEGQSTLEETVAQLTHDGQNVHKGVQPHLPEASRHNPVEVLQPVVNEGYTQHPQQVYLHHYPMQPIRILDAESAALRQKHGNENENTSGYSSYVEHVSQKDKEELRSALKDGSLKDIKRLVPKSGISFKIYHDEKNVNSNLQDEKPEVQANVATLPQPKIPAGYLQHHSRLHHRIKGEVPTTQLKIQTALQHDQQTTGLEGLQQTVDQPQHLLPSLGKTSFSHDQQSVKGQIYYPQQEVNPQKTYLEINGKVKPHIKINTGDGGYDKATSTAEYNSLTGSKGPKHGLSDFSDLRYQKQWIFDYKTEGSQKEVKTLKHVGKLQHEIDPVGQNERARGYHYTQNHPSGASSHVGQNNYNKQNANSFVEKTPKIAAHVNYLSNSYVSKGTQGNFAGHLAPAGHTEQKPTHAVLNRLTGNYINAENLKTGQNHITNHLGTTALGSPELLKSSQHFATHSYSDSEAVKSGQHDIISHAFQNSYVDAKNSQNNFDHQKALEGSTTFDIKNAIDSTGSLVHQTNYDNNIVTSTTSGNALEELQKQQIAYIIPKIPAPTVLIDNSIHQAAEGHQIKDFGHVGQISYHAVPSPDVGGKFFHQPQIVWTSEPQKHGSTLTANDLQHSIIKLHLPKDEIYQHLNPPKLHLPTSSVSHLSYAQQKQPYVIHYDLPVLKYPQEIHFQPNTKTRIQSIPANHIKVATPVTLDWNLLKSALPQIHTLAVKPELATIHDSGKKIVPILVRKRKNRSNQDIGVVYGKVSNNRWPVIPTHRQEKNIRVNLLPEASNNVKQYEPKGERKNEFSVSASYTVDRSFNIPHSS